LEEWVDEDNFGPSITEDDTHISANKNSRIVVLKHMFTLKELEEDPSLLLDLKEDVREECETLGEVTNVVLYDVRQDFPFFVTLSSSNKLSPERTRRGHDGEVQGSCWRTRMRLGTSPSTYTVAVAHIDLHHLENARSLFFWTQS
jgi:hypothetical protein